MVTEKQVKDSAPPPVPTHKRAEKALYFLAEVRKDYKSGGSISLYLIHAGKFFFMLLQAMHNFNATSEKELSLIVGDYVVVRQVCLI